MNKKSIISTLIALQIVAVSANIAGAEEVSDNTKALNSNWNTLYTNLNKANDIANNILGKGNDGNTGEDDNNGGPIDVGDGIIKNKPLDYTLTNHVEKQLSNGKNLVNKTAQRSSEVMTTYMMQFTRSYISAEKEDLEYYINPKTFTSSEQGIMQFLKLNTYREVSVTRLNEYLNKNTADIFHNKGQSFKDAAKKYNIDPIYFVAHSMWETGYGKSTLAQGQVLEYYKGEKLETPVKVYNFFGIGAIDGTANLSGAEAAYKNGWTSIDATIDGSAKWLSDNYINCKYNQDTLYTMRWNYDVVWHQYATDVNWANGITSLMYKLKDVYQSSSSLEFEIPQYK